MNYPKIQPGDFHHLRYSLQNIALVLPGVSYLGRPHSLGAASLRDGCFVTAARITSLSLGIQQPIKLEAKMTKEAPIWQERGILPSHASAGTASAQVSTAVRMASSW